MNLLEKVQVQRVTHHFTICFTEPCYWGFNGTIRSCHLYSRVLSITKSSSSMLFSTGKGIQAEFIWYLTAIGAVGEVLVQFPKVCSIRESQAALSTVGISTVGISTKTQFLASEHSGTQFSALETSWKQRSSSEHRWTHFLTLLASWDAIEPTWVSESL